LKVVSVVGPSGSGKTTTVECIIAELRRRRYSVGSVKEIHFEEFAMDSPGTNTDRHHRAGAELVTALGLFETDVLYKRKLDIREVLGHYHQDFVILEGVEHPAIPRIVTGYEIADLAERVDEAVFAISGRVARDIEEYSGRPALDATERCRDLVDLIERTVSPPLPGFPPDCCDTCGGSCGELTGAILRGEATREACPVVGRTRVQLRINGEGIAMVPFVQSILENAVTGVVGELDGYRPGAIIEVHILPE